MKPTLPMHILQSLQGHVSFVQNVIFSLNIPSEFAFLMSLVINSHILGIRECRLKLNKVPLNSVQILGYNFDFAPTECNTGGTAIYIKKN